MPGSKLPALLASLVLLTPAAGYPSTGVTATAEERGSADNASRAGAQGVAIALDAPRPGRAIKYVAAIRRSTQGYLNVRTALDAEFVVLDTPSSVDAVRRAMGDRATGCSIYRDVGDGPRPFNDIPASLPSRPIPAGEVRAINASRALAIPPLASGSPPESGASAVVSSKRIVATARLDQKKARLDGDMPVEVAGNIFPAAATLLIPSASSIIATITAKGDLDPPGPLYYTAVPTSIPRDVRVHWEPDDEPDASVVLRLFSTDQARDDETAPARISAVRCIVPDADGQFEMPRALLNELDETYQAMTLSRARSTVQHRGNALFFLSEERFYLDHAGPIAPRLQGTPAQR